MRKWWKRFEQQGLAGLEDAPRSGAPARYTAEHKARVLQAARTRPNELGLPYSSWTFERLASCVKEQLGLSMKKTRIFEILSGGRLALAQTRDCFRTACQGLCLWRLGGNDWCLLEQCSPRRIKAHFVDFLPYVDEQIPPHKERIYAILDNLDMHHCNDLLLFMIHHPGFEFVYQPKSLSENR